MTGGAMEDLVINDTVTIPGRELRAESVRAGGPGGQNVNKVASKVTIVFDLPATTALSAAVKARLVRAAGRRVDREGLLRLSSQRHRTRGQNLAACRERLAILIRDALKPPTPRRPTRPPRAAALNRLDAKRRRSRTKELRRPPGNRDE
jgi:ribosome-associated protein